jgi:hypothetical protein
MVGEQIQYVGIDDVVVHRVKYAITVVNVLSVFIAKVREYIVGIVSLSDMHKIHVVDVIVITTIGEIGVKYNLLEMCFIQCFEQPGIVNTIGVIKYHQQYRVGKPVLWRLIRLHIIL